MTKLILSLILVATLSGCGLQNQIKHLKSSVVGLNRKITLYDANGKVIREWNTKAKIEDNGGTCYFITEGKAYTISGTFIIEELL